MGCSSDSQKHVWVVQAFVTPNKLFLFFIIMGDCGITLCQGTKNHDV